MIRRDITDIALQPSLIEMRQHLRITSNSQDGSILPNLKAAAMSAEHHIGRCLEDSVFTYTDSFKQTVTLPEIDTRFYPLKEVNSVKVDGTACTNYSIVGDTLTFSEGVTGSAFEIVYSAGGYIVPDDIKMAIMFIATKFFMNPEDSVEMLPSVATNLLGPHRRWGVNDD